MAKFLDTNVLLYAYDPSAGERHERARALLLELARSKQAAVSVQVLQEFYVNAVSKVAEPMTPAQARERLEAFNRWSVHSPLATDVIAAGVIAEDNRISFWDAMLIRSAAQLDCGHIWTEDLDDGQIIAGVEVRSPF